jgi:hypothetical protein
VGAILACTLLAFAVAAPAQAKEMRFSGKTSQHAKVVLRTDAAGLVKRFVIGYKADCNSTRYKTKQIFVRPFRRANKRAFADRGGYVHKFDNGVTLKVHTRLFGKRVADDRFKGKFGLKARYFDHGKKTATCRAQGIRWVASR